MGAVPDDHENSLRRAPVQQRSAERLDRILEACAVLLDETGYEQLSTRAVAARAGVPIGSVYRFFGNKRAMADALARRNLDVYAERVTARLGGLPAADWRAAIDAVLDEYLEMKRTVPGFALVEFASQGTPNEGNPLVADRLTTLLASHLGRAADEALHRTFLVAVEAADAVLQLAFRTRPEGDPGLVAEVRVLLRAYLAKTLD
ncbi:TetR/AcrR family transcriptional regulator [Streptomyces sp. NPDC050738]|uniref:TetR/AcrR family transcriptional regulator n=1 Tax=Streptomyces sp. NPDC050738 TaxID=3154744 RepID=UPI00342EC183